MYVQLRKVLRNFAFDTGDTHQRALRRNGCEEPLIILRRAVAQLQQCIDSRRAAAPPQDVVRRLTWDHLTPLLARIDAMIAQQTLVIISQDVESEPETLPLLTCECCSFVTHSLANFRLRRAQVHGRRHHRTVAFSQQQHAPTGLPTCPKCHDIFNTWYHFRIHVETHQCRPWQEHRPMAVPRIETDIANGLLTNSRLRAQDLIGVPDEPSCRTILPSPCHGSGLGRSGRRPTSMPASPDSMWTMRGIHLQDARLE